MKISSKLHGIVDYLVVVFLWLSPSIFSLPPITSVFTYGLGAIHLGLTLCTNYEYGLLKYIPLKIHGTIELIVSLVLVALAFYLGSAEGEFARNFFLYFAVAVFVVWLLSDYTNRPKKLSDETYVESNIDGGMI